MTDDSKTQAQPPEDDKLPQPVVRRRRRFAASLIWLVPALAAVIALSLVVSSRLQTGPTITVSFDTAEGLDPGKTPVKYKNVVIGHVQRVRLSSDRSHVLATVELEKSAEGFATKGSRFWVVRPRIGLGGVSGIDTLLSGSFIGADVGESKESQDDFKGLETPPAVNHGAPGRTFVLHADDLGSLDIGSPVYYRRIQVGRVVAYQLDGDGKGVTLHFFVDGPNDKFVTRSSRFWNASGIDLQVGANGLKLDTQSLASVLGGGIAFQDARGPHDSTPASEDASFQLFGDQDTALAPPDGRAQYIRMRFDQSVRGLAVDAPVEFLGINFGKVVSIKLDYDEKNHRFPVVVGALVYPHRLGDAYEKLEKLAGARGESAEMSDIVGRLVERGFRAQARTGNLLTGQLYVALDFVPHPEKVEFDPRARPLTLPTVPGSFDKLQDQMAEIVDKIDKVPFDSIGNNLDHVLAGLDVTLKQVNGQTLPEFKNTLQGVQKTMGTADDALSGDSPLQQNLVSTLGELRRMARSLRVLTDYLSGHPEALIRGRPDDPKLSAPPPAAVNETSRGSKP